jgi:hypothetical protein
MEKIIKESGKPHYIGCLPSDAFSNELFYEVDMRHSESDIQFAFHSDLGSITVLDRLTGYGMGMRDIETGYRAMDGKFWLASGGFDIREKNCATIQDAIDCIKANANNCKGE